MAQAVSQLGKTFDHIAFGLAGRALWSFVFVPAKGHRMKTFLISTGIAAFAKIGDKTRHFAFAAATTIHNLPDRKQHSNRSADQQSACRRESIPEANP